MINMKNNTKHLLSVLSFTITFFFFASDVAIISIENKKKTFLNYEKVWIHLIFNVNYILFPLMMNRLDWKAREFIVIQRNISRIITMIRIQI